MTGRSRRYCAHPDCDNEANNVHLAMVGTRKPKKIPYVLCGDCERSKKRREEAARAIARGQSVGLELL